MFYHKTVGSYFSAYLNWDLFMVVFIPKQKVAGYSERSLPS